MLLQTYIRNWVRQLAVVTALGTLAATAGAQPLLRVLAWPGYADPDVVQGFEKRTGAKVEVTYIDSDEALWAKLLANQAADYDLFAVNTAELQRYLQKGLVAEIDPSAIPNLGRQLPRFAQANKIPGIVRGGKRYAVPYTYAEMGLIYDRAQISSPPTSINVLWDPRYQGKVMLYNGGAHNFSLAALSLGYKTPFAIQSTQWSPLVERLVALRRNALTFYTRLEDSIAQFQSRKAALMFANYGSQQFQQLQAAGANVGYTVPQEGALAWLDCWVITRGARDPALAHAWINYMLEDQPGQVLVSRQGLSNTTSASPFLGQEDKLLWLQPPIYVERRNLLWERIYSGYSANKVLAP
jgi:putative spermidine/putrescine transport system substrate-binding protein